MFVKEIMSTPVHIISRYQNAKNAAIIMRSGNIGALPVHDGDRLVGMLTDRDLTIRVIAEDKNPNQISVEDCMSTGIQYCFDNDKISTVKSKMTKSGCQRFPVLNQEKRLVGMISLNDILIHTEQSTTQKTKDNKIEISA